MQDGEKAAWEWNRLTPSRHARHGRWLVAVAVALLVAGCSSAATPGASPTSPSTAASSRAGSAPVPSTAAASADSSTASAPASYPESQQEYTSILVRAWGAGDRGRAGRYATPAAVEKLFGVMAGGGPRWSLLACDNAGPMPACTFSDRQAKQRLVLFYDAEKLARPRAVLDLEFLSDQSTSTTS